MDLDAVRAAYPAARVLPARVLAARVAAGAFPLDAEPYPIDAADPAPPLEHDAPAPRRRRGKAAM